MQVEYDAPANVTKGGVNVDDYFRVQFFIRNMTAGRDTVDVTWLNTVRCRDFYKDKNIDSYDAEFMSDFWVCPDIENFVIQNNPSTYVLRAGSSLNMVINKCKKAEAVAKLHKLSTYNDNYSNCKDPENDEEEEEFWKIASHISFKSKTMSQEEGCPIEFRENNEETQTYFKNRIASDATRWQGVIYRISAI